MESNFPEENSEMVVLLNASGSPCGTMEKSRVHTQNTPLHSAFSIFLFTDNGLMLTQQRAYSKSTWPGIWSNACCGHPAPGESHIEAAKRRLKYELGIEHIELTLALPNFRYKAVHLGVMENEICPVLIGFCKPDLPITPNIEEVQSVEWVSRNAFFKACEDPINSEFEAFSPWSLMEGRLLKATPWIAELLMETT
jgi:isopentenyl-diphosphate Delta-isomerase